MKYYVLIFLISFLLCCKGNEGGNENSFTSINKDSVQKVLINVDKSWSDSSLTKGYYKSRMGFVADEAIELLDGEMPLTGKKAIGDYTATHSDSSFTMQWKALKAEVAVSGDLGYTFGSWVLRTKIRTGNDTSMFGDYVTVWKKQTDGSWKYILDGGNSTPMEVKE